MNTSADESSRRVWESRGSQGFGGISYYTKGKVIGFALDLAIRAESGNRHSLDDVIRDLYVECKGPNGFSETRIRELCVKYGGDKLGDLYDVCVMQAVRIPIEPLLTAAGLTIVNGVISDDPSATEQSKAVASSLPNSISQRAP
jgi:predicted metalloprotease with PDZ domain